MQAIYNQQGRTVAWLSSKDLYDIKGYFIGYLKGNAVLNRSSEHCGTLKQSFFRGRDGYVVAFLDSAKKGPVLPAKKPSPPKPSKKSKPLVKSSPTTPSAKPFKSRWSKLSWDDYI